MNGHSIELPIDMDEQTEVPSGKFKFHSKHVSNRGSKTEDRKLLCGYVLLWDRDKR